MHGLIGVARALVLQTVKSEGVSCRVEPPDAGFGAERQDITGKRARSVARQGVITASERRRARRPRARRSSPPVCASGRPRPPRRGFDEFEMRQVAGWICARASTRWRHGAGSTRHPGAAAVTRSLRPARARRRRERRQELGGPQPSPPCPFCDERATRVVDSRLARAEGSRAASALPGVQCRLDRPSWCCKSDGTPEPFDAPPPEAIERALYKRPVAAEASTPRSSTYSERLRTDAEREVASRQLGRVGDGELRELDQVAYVRFARCIAVSRTSTPFARRSNGSRRRPPGRWRR